MPELSLNFRFDAAGAPRMTTWITPELSLNFRSLA